MPHALVSPKSAGVGAAKRGRVWCVVIDTRERPHTWMELGESRAIYTGDVSKPLGVQGMAAGQASSLWDQRTPRKGPEGSTGSRLYRAVIWSVPGALGPLGV